MNYNILFNILKYIVLTIAIYSVLKYVLDYNMTNFDTIITTTILVLLIILAETLYKICIGDNFKSIDKKNYCSSVCNRLEPMADISYNTKKDNTKKDNTKKDNTKKDNNKKDNPVKDNPEKDNPEKDNPEKDNVEKDITIEVSDNSLQESETTMQESETTMQESETTMQESETTLGESINTVEEKPNNNNKIEREGNRNTDGVINTEYEYTDYNMLPMAEDNTGNFEYGYSFLPPEKWYPQPPNPPICVSNTKSNVTPVYTTGTPIDVKEWNESRRVTPPDNINTKYIKQKLNSGR